MTVNSFSVLFVKYFSHLFGISCFLKPWVTFSATARERNMQKECSGSRGYSPHKMPWREGVHIIVSPFSLLSTELVSGFFVQRIAVLGLWRIFIAGGGKRERRQERMGLSSLCSALLLILLLPLIIFGPMNLKLPPKMSIYFLPFVSICGSHMWVNLMTAETFVLTLNHVVFMYEYKLDLSLTLTYPAG